MDAAGASPTASPLIFRAATLLLLLCCSVPLNGQTQPEDNTAAARRLFDQQHWQELVQLVESTSRPSAELQYYYGLALAELQRWDDARNAFLAGHRLQPHDRRFPIELAGVAFKQKRYSQAAVQLRRALRLDPHDDYANDFLGTVYYLQGNLQAAVKNWNRAAKPIIAEVKTQQTLRVSPVLLDHVFAFSPAAVLQLEDLRATEARLRALEIFSTYRLELPARADGQFDTSFQAQERNGFGNGVLQSLLGIFRGLPYQQIDPEYYNVRGSSTNIISLLRWDAQKRRMLASLFGPLHHDPRWRYRLSADLRNENWDVRSSFTGNAPSLAGLNLRREEVNAEITRLVGGRWNWSAGVRISRRDYRNVNAGNVLSPQLLAKGLELTQTASINYALLRIPERRFTLTGELASQLGRIWSDPGHSFDKLQASLRSHWLPRAIGDDFETRWDLHAGKTFGQPPFDELFMLGLERDNDLWLRAHIGTRDGLKGSSPLGRNYFLSNWETDKSVYRNGIISLKLGPFIDTGRILDGGTALNAHQWLWDIGGQTKISVLGVGVAFSYGKDLRSGANAFYTRVGR